MIALGILVIYVATTHRWSETLWLAGTTAAALALIALGSSFGRKVYLAFATLFIAGAVVLMLQTIDKGIPSVRPIEINYRLDLGLGNANLLGATLSVWGVASLILLRNGLIRLLTAGPFLIAILLTGSRTALVAFLFAVLCLVADDIVRSCRVKRMRQAVLSGSIVGLFIAVLALIVYGSEANRDSQSPNLLRASDNLSNSVWRQEFAASIRIKRYWSETPYGRQQISRISADSASRHDSGLVLYQDLGPSVSDIAYTASVFLRADAPQEVVIGSNLASVTCTVDTSWQRCGTPVVYGNGRTNVQFQIRTTRPGGSINVDVWGPQVEEGTSPGPVTINSTNLFSEIVRVGADARSNLWTYWQGDKSRADLRAVAWAAFLSSPLHGIGAESLSNRFLSSSAGTQITQPTHAHNVILQQLGTNGLLGFGLLLVPFVAGVYLAFRETGLQSLPLIGVIVALNLADNTLYSATVYYPYWLLVGMLANRRSYLVTGES